MGVKLGPSNWQKGGGLALANADVVIKQARYKPWDYNGTVSPPQVAAELVFAVDEGEDQTQYLSCGKQFDGTPSANGKTVELNGKSTGFNENTNWIVFLKSLVDAGFPQDKLEETDDITILEGLEAHVMLVDAPKRSGIAQTRKGKDGTEYPIQNLVVDKIHKLPWEGKGAGAGNAGAGTGTDNGASEYETEAMDAIMTVLGASAKGMTIKELGAELFKLFKTHANRNQIIKLPYNAEWMAQGPWSVDAKTGIVKLG